MFLEGRTKENGDEELCSESEQGRSGKGGGGVGGTGGGTMNERIVAGSKIVARTFILPTAVD